MIQISNKIKKELIKLAKEYDLDLLILFGSRAKGMAKDSSDYDFAFYSKNKIKLKDFDKLYQKIWEIVNYKDIDLVNISTIFEH